MAGGTWRLRVRCALKKSVLADAQAKPNSSINSARPPPGMEQWGHLHSNEDEPEEEAEEEDDDDAPSDDDVVRRPVRPVPFTASECGCVVLLLRQAYLRRRNWAADTAPPAISAAACGSSTRGHFVP